MDVFIRGRFQTSHFHGYTQPKKRRPCCRMNIFPLKQGYIIARIWMYVLEVRRPASNFFLLLLIISWALLVGVLSALPYRVHRSKTEISQSKFDCYIRDDLRSKAGGSGKTKHRCFKELFLKREKKMSKKMCMISLVFRSWLLLCLLWWQ